VVDVAIIAAPNIDKLIMAGKVVAGSRADLARSGVGVAMRSGLPKPDISSGDAVKKAVLAANSVACSSAPDEAKELLKFLTSPEAGATIWKIGMEPGWQTAKGTINPACRGHCQATPPAARSCPD